MSRTPMLPSQRRRGFTLVELLIVIAIIGVLMGLLIPAIQAAREKARQATCLNNIGQLAKATHNHVTGGKPFPGYVSYEKLADPTNSGRNALPITWAAKLLANLDQQGLRDQMIANDNTFLYDNPPRLDVMLCPSDVQLNEEVGAITYVANTGMPDPVDHPLPSSFLPPNGAGSPDMKANGVFHDHRPFRGEVVKVKYGGGDLRDGQDMTIMYSENFQKDQPTTWLGPINSGAAGPIAANTAPDMDQNPEQRYGMIWIATNNAVPPDQDVLQPFNKDTRNPSDPSSGRYTDPSQLPESYLFARPASEHPEVFMVAFCGASAKEVADSIDYRVYQQLMTPNGAKAAPADAPNSNLKYFMVPPLADGDF